MFHTVRNIPWAHILTHFAAGDIVRGTQIASLGHLLALGVRVALLYGDADYICNWYGGEAVSLALAALVPNYASAFPAAGYADIIVNSSYVGGAVRQFGNLSFSRIYDSGHLVPAYQPETAFTVFTRIIEGTDLGTGEPVSLEFFATKGPQYSNHTNKAPSEPESTCWIRDINDTCTQNQINSIMNFKGVVIDGVWYEDSDDYSPPASTVIAGVPGSLPISIPTSSSHGATSSSAQLTGVYVATGTPKPTSGAMSARLPPRVFEGDNKRFLLYSFTGLAFPLLFSIFL